ncbi:MAG: hypothetical protein RMJ98_14905, partial [Myxococcales bacterium]|nr:hypothetical protein [Myxococcales bacterium]
PLLFQRSVGRGSVLVVTLPASTESSDLPLRPAFLDLLARALEAGRGRQLGQRSPVGSTWFFPEMAPDEVVGPGGPLTLRDTGGGRFVVAERAGLYTLRFGHQRELRVAEIEEREIDTRPRPASAPSQDHSLGSPRATLDASPYVALVLLMTIAAEAALRLLARREQTPSRGDLQGNPEAMT